MIMKMVMKQMTLLSHRLSCFTIVIVLNLASSSLHKVAAENNGQLSPTYEDLQEQNELLSEELHALRTRLRYLTAQCTCPGESKCEYKGVEYGYGAVFRGGDCERCSCDQNGQVSCRYDSTIPGCQDGCMSNPCFNGGTCRGQSSGGYVCICPPGCTGAQCQFKDAHTCHLPYDEGYACDATTSPVLVFFFDAKLEDCVQRAYLGCGGNNNRFSAYSECKMSCVTGTCCTRKQLRTDSLYGHSPAGYDRYGFWFGVNEQGERATVPTATAFGSLRYRFQGVDYKGYRADGYNKDRYSQTGYNCAGVDADRLNEDGLVAGFSYTCEITTKTECMERVHSSDLREEIVAFSAGDTECKVSVCNNSTQCRGCEYNGKHYEIEEVFTDACNQCMCTRTGSVQCSCSKTINRKEIRDLTAAEVAEYQRAVRKLYSQGKWTRFSEMYEKYLPHSHSNGRNFLAWHRAMLSQLEKALQTVSGSCDLTIPYFDWTMDTGAMLESPIWRAGLFGGNGSNETECVDYHPFTDRVAWSPCLRRKFGNSFSLPLPDAVAVENIKRSTNFTALNNQLSSASLLFRLWVGGHAHTRNAVYDPVVISHLAFIDKIWHDWQQRGDNYINLDPVTRFRPIAPFGVSLDDINSSPLQLCVRYAPLNSLCSSDTQGLGRPYSLADPRAFDADGFDSAGFDRLGYNRHGYNGDGFNREGYDIQGYDRYGFNRNGVSKNGVVRTGETNSRHDPSILDKQNFTRLGLDVRGLDFGGRDIFGYDSRGYDSSGCNGHYNDGYQYVKQKYELDLELSAISQSQLDKISRLCAAISSPHAFSYMSSWVIVDPTHTLRGNLPGPPTSRQVPEANIWIPDGPDSRFCVEINIYSSCGLGEKPSHSSCTTDLCEGRECPSYRSEATCRTVGCDNSCRREWYHNGMIITPSCLGCKDASSDRYYGEGDTWLSADGCSRCECVAGTTRCSGCPRTTCTHPDESGCCAVCNGCTYEGMTYSNQEVFLSQRNPCNQCQCRDGTVTCVTRRCPSLRDCRDPVTLEGSCCAICLSCGHRHNGAKWNEDECTSCECKDGRTKCQKLDCGTSRCTHPVKVLGVCCPQCQACFYQRSYYNNGQTFSPDGCQSCTCERGNVRCTPPTCPDINCDFTYTPSGACCPVCQEGCEYSGQQYEDGAVFSPSFNRCMNCTCSEHKVRCGNVRCPPTSQLKCSRPIALPGDCCPSFCPTCVFEGQEYVHQDRWQPASRPCEVCMCFDGAVSCKTRTRCRSTCSYGVLRDNECCSACTDCELDGEIHRDGSTFARMTSRGCAECTCQSGNIQCSSPTQSCPSSDCMNPVQIPNTCCPLCPSCSNGRRHGDRWRNEADQCEICECRDEVVKCYRQPCPVLTEGCVTTSTPQGDCCPVCMDCLASGQLYPNGTEFKTRDDPCSSCICLNSEVSCVRTPCPSVPCSKPVMLPGSCCATCDSCLLDNGETFTHGETFESRDSPCDTCICDSGSVVCTPNPCTDLHCNTPVLLPGNCCPTCGDCITDNGTTYSNGERFPSPEDKCSECLCINSQVSCSRRVCPAVPCLKPVMLPGNCCPTCDNCQLDSGQIYANGETITEEGNTCSSCKCVSGSVVCTPNPCPDLHCETPVLLPGNCCPTCGDCNTDNGTAYSNGERFLSPEDKCSDCLCINEVVKCKRRACPSVSCESPVVLPGKCCPTCVTRTCEYNGVTIANGESVKDGCRECRCDSGRVNCWRESCPPLLCSNPVMGECCPECTDCFYNDMVIASGSSIYNNDTCTTCDCADGNLLCTTQVCAIIDCTHPIQDGCCPSCTNGCVADGRHYADGETVKQPSNPCETCTCSSGSLVCTHEICSALPFNCPMTYQPEGECCSRCSKCADPRPFVPPESHTGNAPLGFIYPRNSLRIRRSTRFLEDGESYFDYDTCSNCTCDLGFITCAVTSECPPVSCEHPRTDGCCPSCHSGCTIGNLTFSHGEVKLHPENPECFTCNCNGGTVTCYPNCSNIHCEYGGTVDECGCPICNDNPVCRSEANSSISYQSGDSWYNDDNCACICKKGEVVCETCEVDLACPFTEIDSTSCCGKKCKGCTVDQIHYTSGATWSEDGCKQTCSCHSGIVTCIEVLSSGDHCIASPSSCSPIASGAPLGSCCTSTPVCECQGPNGPMIAGEMFTLNRTDVCSVCTCLQGSDGQSTYLECQQPICPDVSGCPVELLYYPDLTSCCPLCKKHVGFECTAIEEGTVVTSESNPCEECTCTGNTWFCSTQTCPDIDCPLNEQLTRPDQCCPICVGCYTDSIRKAHGASWQHDTDPCATCRCDYGNVICETTVLCPPLFCTEGRKPFTPVGECCEICGDPVTGDDCLDSRGKTRPHGSGWPIDDCTSCECLFGKANCTSEHCPHLECKSDETLVIEEGICCPKCVKQPAVCKVYGDPHYKTFDGETVHFQGFCSYEMVADCDSNTFKIVAVHDDRDTESVSWIKGVLIEAGALSIKLGQGLWSEVNGVNVTFPFQHQSGLVIRERPTALDISANHLGFKLTWDGSAYSEVEVETSLKGKLCGLCGNFNDDNTDELKLRDGTLVSSHATFGESWLVEGAECSARADDQHPCQVAGYDIKKKAIEECAIIQGDLFSPCHRVVPPEDYVYSCVYDMCACNSTAECLCDMLTAYSAACSNSYVRIQWRTHDRCAMNCDETKGFLFDECGPVCPRTCKNYQRELGDIGKDCLKPCEPSCQCPAGLVQHNGRCITTDMCP